jgi:hypothetical protein
MRVLRYRRAEHGRPPAYGTFKKREAAMKIIKALIVLGICALVVEFYRDWSGLSGNSRSADSDTSALSADDDTATEGVQDVDGETSEVAGQAAEDSGKTDTSATDKVKSDAEQMDTIQRIDVTYTKTVFRV